MKTNKMNPLYVKHMLTCYALAVGFSLSLLLSFLVLPLSVDAAVDIDTSGNGRAAAFDDENGIATDGDSFCSITNDIAGGKFSSLFEGIVGEDCDNNSQSLNQFLVEYSFSKNPVKVGEKSLFIVTVKDKETGNPISDAFVTLNINSPSSSPFETSSFSAAVAVAAISLNQNTVQEKSTQVMHTDNNGHTSFTVKIGPKSELGIYDTELEIKKDSYQSSFEQIDFRVV
ncbi:MAG: hypothetical protein WBX01_10840 [Nitrososphaeraceae archaeon]